MQQALQESLAAIQAATAAAVASITAAVNQHTMLQAAELPGAAPSWEPACRPLPGTAPSWEPTCRPLPGTAPRPTSYDDLHPSLVQLVRRLSPDQTHVFRKWLNDPRGAAHLQQTQPTCLRLQLVSAPAVYLSICYAFCHLTCLHAATALTCCGVQSRARCMQSPGPGGLCLLTWTWMAPVPSPWPCLAWTLAPPPCGLTLPSSGLRWPGTWVRACFSACKIVHRRCMARHMHHACWLHDSIATPSSLKT